MSLHHRSAYLTATIIALMIFFSGGGVQAGLLPDSLNSDSSFRVNDILIIGNKITKDQIILRELTFHKGDTITDLDSTFRRCEQNLLNTSLFHKADITCLKEGGSVVIYIILAERWYVFPVPIFEVVDRNFNEWWKRKDFSRVNYGMYLYWNNFRGRNETITLSIRLGYTQRLSLYYEIPFINKKQKAGLIFSASYLRNKEIGYSTIGDKLAYLKDENDYLRRELGYSVQYTYRPDLYVTHLVEAGFRKAETTDTVIKLNPGFFADQKNSEQYSILRYAFRIDYRDIKIYPLKGSYFDVEFIKNGFSLINDDVDLFYVASNYRKYFDLGRKFYLGTGVKGKISGTAFQPYYNTRGLGYGRDVVRGYEYYVVDGQKYLLVKTNLKYELISKRYMHAKFIPFEKFSHIPYAFYLNIYGDAAYVDDNLFAAGNGNVLPNSLLFGYGAGIDFVSYYDIVFRFEYSFNKFGESGIFIHFTASI